MTEMTFIAHEAEEGGYHARAVGASIFTQAETLEELRLMIKDAIECHFDNDADKPKLVHLHVSHDEVFAI
jgi:predicted RNase H-like HicB family nuclease